MAEFDRVCTMSKTVSQDFLLVMYRQVVLVVLRVLGPRPCAPRVFTLKSAVGAVERKLKSRTDLDFLCSL